MKTRYISWVAGRWRCQRPSPCSPRHRHLLAVASHLRRSQAPPGGAQAPPGGAQAPPGGLSAAARASLRPKALDRRARYPVRSGAQLHEVAAQRVYGRRHRDRHQLQGAYLRQHLRPANPQFRIRSERQLRAGDREGPLRHRVLSWHSRRCPGQHLGDRRGRQHRSSSSTPKAA